MRLRFRLLVVVLGQVMLAALVGVQLQSRGALTAAAGGYLTFAATLCVVDLWTRLQLRLAQRRLALARQRATRIRAARR